MPEDCIYLKDGWNKNFVYLEDGYTLVHGDYTIEALNDLDNLSRAVGPRHYIIEKNGSTWEVHVRLKNDDFIRGESNNLNDALRIVIGKAVYEKLK